MDAALKIGTAVVSSAVKLWLANRKSATERDSSLPELVRARLDGGIPRRRFTREIDALTDVVAERLEPLCRQVVPELDEAERQAALAEVATTFDEADLDDADLFHADVDAAKLARRLRAHLPDRARRAGLSEAGTWYYQAVLEECCACYVRLVVHLTPFAARASAELLGRVSGLSEQLERVLSRMPAPTLLAPHGTGTDAAFRARYLRLVSETLDSIELFGLDTHAYRPRTTLSVAYISLTVRREDPGQVHELVSWHADTAQGQDSTVRVERALAKSSRVLIRGEAGSGKSTLLHWLAINAARGTFRGDLAGLNGHIPFLIKLRSYSGRPLPGPEAFLDEVAQPLAGMMPSAYVHRQLESGHALLLVDGVDELVATERGAVRTWLSGLTHAFPDVRVVLTSRPAGAAESWLRAEGFTSAWLERMSQADVRALIRHWHKAARSAGNLPCDEADLPRYEGVLLSRLEANPHLRALATSPLLCAMLCALNLDRSSFLPRNRLELYVTALSMLLDRRDAERGIVASVKPSGQESRQLLRHLAWRLSVNGRSELSKDEAIRRIGERLATTHTAEALLDHLVQRSGLVREPVAGRIDFVHRTFQEFLTAEEAADQGDIGLLIQNAHLDQWRDIVVMTAGLANAPLRHELFTGLFDRADAEPRLRRKLSLLAAAATESAPALTKDLAARMERSLAELIPPKRAVEARSLAAAGEVLLPRLPRDARDLSEAAAAATVRTAALINGPDAWPVLEQFSQDPRRRVQEELIAAWKYFDPDEYATRILADAPLLDGKIRIEDQALLPMVSRLRNLSHLELYLFDLTDLTCLDGLPRLRHATLEGDFDDLSPLARCVELEHVVIDAPHRVDPTPLTKMPELRRLFLYPHAALTTNIEFLRRMPRLEMLGLRGLDQVDDFSALAALEDVTLLALYQYPKGVDLRVLAELPALRSLDLGSPSGGGALGVRNGLAGLADRVPALHRLGFLQVQPLDELDQLARFPELSTLSVRYCDVADFTALTTVASLRTIESSYLGDDHLAQIGQLAQLTTLVLVTSDNDPRDIDLSPLGDAKLTVRTYRDRHRFVGKGKNIKVAWL